MHMWGTRLITFVALMVYVAATYVPMCDHKVFNVPKRPLNVVAIQFKVPINAATVATDLNLVYIPSYPLEPSFYLFKVPVSEGELEDFVKEGLAIYGVPETCILLPEVTEHYTNSIEGYPLVNILSWEMIPDIHPK